MDPLPVSPFVATIYLKFRGAGVNTAAVTTAPWSRRKAPEGKTSYDLMSWDVRVSDGFKTKRNALDTVAKGLSMQCDTKMQFNAIPLYTPDKIHKP